MRFLILLLLLSLPAHAQTPFVSTRSVSMNVRGVYQIRETTNGVPFSVFDLLIPTNTCGAIVCDFSAETSAGPERAIQSGQIRMIAMNIGGVITAETITANLAELDSGGALVVTPGNITTSTMITLRVTMSDATRTNRVFNYRVTNLDTNIVAAPYGLPLLP